MRDYFKSIKKGAEEALAWKQGRKKGARVRQYTVVDVAESRKNVEIAKK